METLLISHSGFTLSEGSAKIKAERPPEGKISNGWRESQGRHRAAKITVRYCLRTMGYSLRRALSLDSIDSCTHNPTSERRQKLPAVLSEVRLARSDYPDLQRPPGTLNQYKRSRSHSEKAGVRVLGRIPDLGEESFHFTFSAASVRPTSGQTVHKYRCGMTESGLPLPA